MGKVLLLPLILLSSCKSSFFDPTTHTMAIVVGELVGAYLLKAGDHWAEKEILDDDEEWKDYVAELYLNLRKEKNLSDAQCKNIDRQVSKSLKELKNVSNKN